MKEITEVKIREKRLLHVSFLFLVYSYKVREIVEKKNLFKFNIINKLTGKLILTKLKVSKQNYLRGLALSAWRMISCILSQKRATSTR